VLAAIALLVTPARATHTCESMAMGAPSEQAPVAHHHAGAVATEGAPTPGAPLVPPDHRGTSHCEHVNGCAPMALPMLAALVTDASPLRGTIVESLVTRIDAPGVAVDPPPPKR